MSIEIITADYRDSEHAEQIGMLLNCYATDPMGGGEPLSDEVKANLASQLAQLPHAFSVIAYVDGQPAALANCFEVFSTFKCQPIINIHDLVVTSEFRHKGMGLKMLEYIEQFAREKGCCKITLEVLEGNRVARNAYEKFGFAGYQLDPAMGQAIFLDKPL